MSRELGMASDLGRMKFDLLGVFREGDLKNRPKNYIMME